MAANNLGTLTLDLIAKIGNFVAPLDQAERKAKKSNEGIAKSFDVSSLAAKAFGAVVAGVSIGALEQFMTKTIDAGNEITRFSKLANASVQQFQYYSQGALTAGISIEKFADQMKDMQDRIGDFQQTGGGPLADFFKNIAPLAGVTIQQFQKLSGPDALQLFYDSLVKVGATQNDIKFYMEQIISDSSLLIPLLENGGAGFKKWGDEAQKAGKIMSDSLVKDLTTTKENLRTMQMQWDGLKVALVSGIVPVIMTVSENMDTVKASVVALSAAVAVRFVPTMIVAGFQLTQLTAFSIRAGVGLLGLAGSAGNASVALVVLRAVSGVLGGPLGIGMLAVQGIAAYSAFQYMKKGSDDLKPSLLDQQLTIQELTKKYAELNAEQRQFEASKLREKIEEETRAVELASNQYVALAISKDGVWSLDQINAYNEMVQNIINKGKDTNSEFQKIKATGLFSTSDLDQISKYNVAYGSANKTLKDHQGLLDKLEGKENNIAKAYKETTNAINNQSYAYKNLTEKQREALKGIDSSLEREKYLKQFIAAGGTRERAEFFADHKEKAGIAYNTAVMSPLEIAKVNQGFASKNYTFTKSELAAIAKVNGIASANNFAQIESLYGLPKGTLAALVLKESSGNANAISPTGAKGLFQTTSVFRKQYGLNANSSIEAQGAAAAKDLATNLQKFGSLDKALMAYNAGADGLNSYLNGGLSDSKRKEVAGYVPGFSKWFAGANGKTEVDQSVLMPSQADMIAQSSAVLEAQKVLDDKRKSINAKYYSEEQQLAQDHRDRIDQINEAFGGTKELKSKLAEENRLYKSQTLELEANKKQEYQKYFEFEKDRISQIKNNYDIQKQLIEASTKYSNSEKQKITAALERQKQSEIDAVKREENQQVQSAFEAYLNETEIVLKRYKVERDEITKNYQLSKETREKLLQANSMNIFYEMNKASDQVYQQQAQSSQYMMQRLDPARYQKWDLQNQYSSASSDLFSSYGKDVSGANSIEDEDKRNAELLAARERYLQAKEALNDEYAQRERDLNVSMAEDQLNAYNSILGTASSLFGNMASMAKDAYGESSAAYKTMFFMQQSIAIGQATINAFLAYSQVLSQAPYPLNMTLAPIALGMGMANVGMIAGQTIAGMAHDGIDNIPKEGTWLLDGGERVLNPQQNKDLTNYLADAGTNQPASPNINLNPNFVIVDERQSLGDYLYGPDGKKAFVKFFKQNRRELGLA